MSLAADGDLRPEAARAAWCAAHDIPLPEVPAQAHGTLVLDVDAVDYRPGCADALVSRHPSAALGVFGADCPPLVLVAPDALAVAHCGWRGTAAGMVSAIVSALVARSAQPPSTWTALVGPGVHPDDYEVDAAVLAATTWPPGTLTPGRPGHAWLDLPAAVAAQVAACGVGAVARSPWCTSRDPRLRSFRRHGSGPPQLFVAWTEKSRQGTACAT